MVTSNTIQITNRAMAAIRSVSFSGRFKQTGHQLPSGDWIIPVDEETVIGIVQAALNGESFSDTIERVIALSTTGGKAN